MDSAAQDVDSVFERSLRDNGIPPCPAVLAQIHSEMRQPTPNLRRMADIIGADVGLSAGIVKTANSPYFGAHRPVSSIPEAMMLLGLDAVSRAVACVVLHRSFPRLRHIERFWDSSARIAALSGWLAQQGRWPGVRLQDAYTFGLFRDCGIAVLLQRDAGYAAVLKRANAEEERLFTEIEDDAMAANHAVIGAMLTQAWWLPESICRALRHHHDRVWDGDIARLAPAGDAPARQLIAIAQVAEHLYQCITGMGNTCEWSKLGAACRRQLSLGEEDLRTLQKEAKPVLTSAH